MCVLWDLLPISMEGKSICNVVGSDDVFLCLRGQYCCHNKSLTNSFGWKERKSFNSKIWLEFCMNVLWISRFGIPYLYRLSQIFSAISQNHERDILELLVILTHPWDFVLIGLKVFVKLCFMKVHFFSGQKMICVSGYMEFQNKGDRWDFFFFFNLVLFCCCFTAMVNSFGHVETVS